MKILKLLSISTLLFNPFKPFNSLNPNQILIDTNYDGSIIIINYIFNINSLNLTTFNYYNFYIIKDYEIYFLKINSNYQNSFITSSSEINFPSKK